MASVFSCVCVCVLLLFYFRSPAGHLLIACGGRVEGGCLSFHRVMTTSPNPGGSAMAHGSGEGTLPLDSCRGAPGTDQDTPCHALGRLPGGLDGSGVSCDGRWGTDTWWLCRRSSVSLPLVVWIQSKGHASVQGWAATWPVVSSCQ